MVVLVASVQGLEYVVTRVGSQFGGHDTDHPLVMTGMRHRSAEDAEKVAATGVPRAEHNGNMVFVDRSKHDLEVVVAAIVFPHLDTGSDVDCTISRLIEK